MRQSFSDIDGRNYHGPAVPVSVVILTHNEAHNIAQCLESCKWCDDVHVLDSGSTDGTVEMARSLGATVHHNPFVSFGQQRNWAIDHIPTKHDWQFHLDADERFTVPLLREMLAELGEDGWLSIASAYNVPSKMIFLNKWVRHSAGYPAYQVRLLHKARCRFSDFGHGQRELTSGWVAALVNPYLHFAFSKGMRDWFDKHNRYSDHESHEAVAARKMANPWHDILFGDPVNQRRAVKSLAYRLRGRSLWRFIYMYFFKGGWLDAGPGFHYCAMIAMYEYWTELKIRESTTSWLEKNRALESRLLNAESQI